MVCFPSFLGVLLFLQLVCGKGFGWITLLSLLMMSFSPTAADYWSVYGDLVPDSATSWLCQCLLESPVDSFNLDSHFLVVAIYLVVVNTFLYWCVCVCAHMHACVHVCVCLCAPVYALRRVSTDKILHYTNTFIIIITLQPKHQLRHSWYMCMQFV